MKKTLNKFIQKEDGLHISVVRAQRIYNNSKWPNPITVKLEYVVPALYPPVVETVKADVAESKVTLKAKLIKRGDLGFVKAGFEYRPYGGFVENLYSTNWDKSKLVEISEEKEFSIDMDNLEPGTTYEYRAVVVHPRMSIYGDIKQVRAGK